MACIFGRQVPSVETLMVINKRLSWVPRQTQSCSIPYVTIVMSAGISADAEVEQRRLPDLASTLELVHDAVGAGHHWKLSPGAARYDARTCDGNGGRGFLQHVNKMQITTTLATSTDWP